MRIVQRLVSRRGVCLILASGVALWAAEAGAQTINYRSIGGSTTQSGTTPTTGVNVVNGSAVVNAQGTPNWVTANWGRGDRITFDAGVTYYTVLSVNSQTQLTLTAPFGQASGGKSYVIGRKFTSLTAWDQCIEARGGCTPYDPNPASASLVANNRSEVGIVYKDLANPQGAVIEIGSGTFPSVLLTTDATRFVTLTADPGNRHSGVAGAAGAHAMIDGNFGGSRQGMLRIGASYTVIEWLELKRTCTSCGSTGAIKIDRSSGAATNLLFRNLLIHDHRQGITYGGAADPISLTLRNSIVYALSGDAPSSAIETESSSPTFSGVTVENVTIFGTGANSAAFKTGIGTLTVKNTITVNHATAAGDLPTPCNAANTNNLSQFRAAGTCGVTQGLMAPADTNQGSGNFVVFNNCPTGAGSCTSAANTYDLHLRTSTVNRAVDTGADLSGSFDLDIDGQHRPSGAAWDIGADELNGFASADLGVTKTDGQTSAVPGNPVSYTITATNNGPDTLQSLFVNDAVPAGITGAALTPSTGTYNSGTGEWTGLNLATSQSVTLTLSGTIDPLARNNLVNPVTVSPPTGVIDLNGLNDSASDTNTLDPTVDVSVVKTDDVDPAPLGGLLTYTLVVSNNGPSGATGVTLQDPLPPDVSLDSGAGAITTTQGACGYTTGTRTVDCTLGSIVPGTPVTVTIKVRPQSLGTIVNTATISHPNEPDSDSGNDSASETTTVVASTLGVRFMTVTSTDKRNGIEWVNPTDPDYVSTEILVRGDHFSNGPGDGFSLYNAGTAGARDKFVHLPGALSNGQTFYYAAFVHRAVAPFVSDGRFVTGRPFDHVPGPVKWAFSTGAFSLTAPTVGGAGVIATANDHAVYAMERGIDDDHVGVDSGEWPAAFQPIQLGGPVQQRSPVVPVTVASANPVVYLGAQDGKLYVVDAARGSAGGGFPVGPTAVGPMLQAAPAGLFAAFGGTRDYLLIGTRDSGGPNAFAALNPYTGALVDSWNNGGAGAGAIGIINGMAAVDYGPPLPPRAYFTSHAGQPVGSTNTLWCFELPAAAPIFSSSVCWVRQLGDIDSSPVLRGGRVYVGSPQGGGTVFSLDALTGFDDRFFVHNNGQVKSFVFPDRASNELYFATDDSVWGVTDNGVTIANKFAGSINLPGGAKPSPVLFTPGSHFVYVGGSDGKLYEIDVQPAVPVIKSVQLGDGLAVVGAPSLDRGFNLVHVGTVAGIFYAVQVPLP